MKIHGILEIDDVDVYGETFNVDGCDLSAPMAIHIACGDLVVGHVVSARVIHGLSDCRNDTDQALLDVARGKPFIKITGSLETEWTREKTSALYFAIWGSTLARSGKRIEKSIAKSVELTHAPAHKAFRVFLGEG